MDGKVDLLGLKPPMLQECQASSIECARVSGAMFMNYLGIGKDFGGDAKREADVMQGFVDIPVIWNIANGIAEVPVKADGTTPKLTMTDIRDIGRFVAAACTLPDGKWQSSMEMVGETINGDEVIKLIEEASGKKLKRRPVDEAELQHRADSIEGIRSSREEMVTKMISQINVAMIEEKIDMCVLNPTVNKLCSDVKPTSVRVFLTKCWK